MEDLAEKITEKKIYQKPQLTEVKLVAQEAVLATCKHGNVSALASDCPFDLTCTDAATS
jgi:hypothetical protein